MRAAESWRVTKPVAVAQWAKLSALAWLDAMAVGENSARPGTEDGSQKKGRCNCD